MTFSNCFRLSAKMVLLISLCLSLLSHKYTRYAYASQSDEQKKLTKTEYVGDYSEATKEEIKKYWNDLDISKLYWKDGKIQAAVALKKYISNPITNEKFSKAEYKITCLHSRDEILEKAK